MQAFQVHLPNTTYYTEYGKKYENEQAYGVSTALNR